jgi:hypothetical protein
MSDKIHNLKCKVAVLQEEVAFLQAAKNLLDIQTKILMADLCIARLPINDEVRKAMCTANRTKRRLEAVREDPIGHECPYCGDTVHGHTCMSCGEAP